MITANDFPFERPIIERAGDPSQVVGRHRRTRHAPRPGIVGGDRPRVRRVPLGDGTDRHLSGKRCGRALPRASHLAPRDTRDVRARIRAVPGPPPVRIAGRRRRTRLRRVRRRPLPLDVGTPCPPRDPSGGAGGRVGHRYRTGGRPTQVPRRIRLRRHRDDPRIATRRGVRRTETAFERVKRCDRTATPAAERRQPVAQGVSLGSTRNVIQRAPEGRKTAPHASAHVAPPKSARHPLASSRMPPRTNGTPRAPPPPTPKSKIFPAPSPPIPPPCAPVTTPA